MPSANSLRHILNELKRGRMVVLVDRDDRESEADLFFPAALATPALVNFSIREGRGLVCSPLTAERALRLELPLMVPPEDNRETHRCQFTVSVDAAADVGTGISAADRATTLRRLADPQSAATNFVRPGHVFPLVAAGGGLAERDGHTEAAVALCQLAQLPPVGVICELMNPDGTMARGDAVTLFANRHGLAAIAVAAIAAAARPTLPPATVRRIASAKLPTAFGEFTIHVFVTIDGKEHVALVYGDPTGAAVPVRLHSQCLTGDTFHSLKCDCAGQLQTALEQIAAAGSGLLLYLNQEGRGIGLVNKIRAYALQDRGLDTVEANVALGYPPDARDYGVAADILANLNVQTIKLLTNNPSKVQQLQDRGIQVVERIPLLTAGNGLNRRYLQVKAAKLGHQLPRDH